MKGAIVLLILFISFMEGLEQNPRAREKMNGKEIYFQTKVKDACTMSITGNGEAKLRIECRNRGKAYWCEYTAKPYLCHPFNNNPRTYWNQIAMELRKRNNACYSNLVLKPRVCQRISEAHMKQVGSSIRAKTNPVQQVDAVNHVKMVQKPPLFTKHVKESQAAKGSIKKPGKPKPSSLPVVTTNNYQQGQVSGNDSEAMKLARKHCWESLHNICSYIISIFKG
ncbi:fibroblast growth factor-binding protein 2 [Sceloporus undulatus]|uniref:fibroblast growth factor-binding protein 2 n=1 Tax=Sceloporus undulatus TaxID=8520 RepID=UPI001C4C61FC|nr:fibroblast growth factor-binding protein 2 [Sceloporus undulatus]